MDKLNGQWSKKQEIEHRTQMISYRILSEIEKVLERRGLTKKELAQKIGTSASYITQLYRGNKLVNMHFMGKCEEALGISFEIKNIF